MVAAGSPLGLGTRMDSTTDKHHNRIAGLLIGIIAALLFILSILNA